MLAGCQIPPTGRNAGTGKSIQQKEGSIVPVSKQAPYPKVATRMQKRG